MQSVFARFLFQMREYFLRKWRKYFIKYKKYVYLVDQKVAEEILQYFIINDSYFA